MDNNLTLYAQWKDAKAAFRSYGNAPKADENYTYGPIGTRVELNEGNAIKVGRENIEDNWKVFYEDNDFVYLIYGNYYPSIGVQKNNQINSLVFSDNSSNLSSVSDNMNRNNLLKYLRNNSEYTWSSSTDNFGNGGSQYVSWKKLKIALSNTSVLSGKNISIQGSPDIEMWEKSWTTKDNCTIFSTSIKNGNGYQIYGTSSKSIRYTLPWSGHSIQADGTGYFDDLYFPNRDESSNGYWLASPGYYSSDAVCCVTNNGSVSSNSIYNNRYYSVRPVISIEKNAYTITYYANTGTDTNSVESKNPNKAYIISYNEFSGPNGKVFKEWNTKADGTGTSYKEGTAYNIDESLILYAQWMDSSIAFRSYGDIPEIVGNYTFGTIGTRVELNEGNDIIVGTEKIQDNWKVFYEDNDYVYLIYGDYYPSSGSQVNNDINSILLNTSTYYTYSVNDTTNRLNLLKYLRNNSEYTWNTSSPYGDNHGTGGNSYISWNKLKKALNQTSVLSGKKLSVQGSPDIELWDKSWTAKENCSIINTSSKTNSSGYYIYGASNNKNVQYTTPWSGHSIQADGTGYYDELYFPYRESNGKALGYWLASPGAYNTNSLCGVYYDGNIYCNISYNSTYYCARPVVAVKKEGYIITYEANTGAGDMDSEIKVPGKNYIIENNGFAAPTGKIFKEWNTQADGSGVTYKESSLYTLDSNLTLYAQWKDGKRAFRSYGEAPNASGNYTYGPIGTKVELNEGNDISVDAGTIQDNWKVFYEDNDFVYLIYGNYYPIKDLQSNREINTMLLAPDANYKYGISDTTNRENLLKYLRNYSNYSWTSSTDTFGGGGTEYSSWKKLRVALENTTILNGKTISIQGSPDIELWDKSWIKRDNNTIFKGSIKNSSGYLIYGTTSGQSVTNSPWEGHSIQADKTGYYDELYFPNRTYNNNAYGYWLASPGGSSTTSICSVNDGGTIYCSTSYSTNYYCVRPVVAIEKEDNYIISYNANTGTGTMAYLWTFFF